LCNYNGLLTEQPVWTNGRTIKGQHGTSLRIYQRRDDRGRQRRGERSEVGVGADGVRPYMERAHAMRPDTISPNPMPPKPQKPDVRRASLRRVPRSLGSFIAGFKASVTSRAERNLNMTGIWQRNYYEHIIRNDRELNNIRWYIRNNPLNWQLDRDNLQNIRKLPPPEKVEEYVKDVEDMALKLHSAA